MLKIRLFFSLLFFTVSFFAQESSKLSIFHWIFDVHRRIYDGNDLISVADKSNQTLTIKHFSYDKGAILRTSFTFIRRSSYMIYQQNQSHQWRLNKHSKLRYKVYWASSTGCKHLLTTTDLTLKLSKVNRLSSSLASKLL